MFERPKSDTEEFDPLIEIVANLPLLHLVGGLAATLLPFAGLLIVILGALLDLRVAGKYDDLSDECR